MNRASRLRTFGLTIAFLAGLVSSLSARELTDKEWIGQEVLPKEGYVVTMGDQVIERDSDKTKVLSIPWTVQKVNGELFLVGDSRKGWVRRNQVVKALDAEYYSAFLDRNPNNLWAYNCRAIAWETRGKRDLAMADYDEVLRIDPTHAVAFRGRGNLWLRKGEYDKAISDYGEAIRLNPKDYLAYVNRGGTWENKQEYDKAISDYGEAIRLNPNDSLAYEGRGGTWHKRGDYDKAIDDYTQAIKINPNSINYSERGGLWAHQKVYDKAISDFRDAIRIDPDSPFAYADFAWILATCPDAKYRNGTKAVEYAKKAEDLVFFADPLGYEEVLAAAYAETGDFDEAVKWQQKAIETFSSDSEFAGFVEEANKVLQLYRQKKPYRDE